MASPNVLEFSRSPLHALSSYMGGQGDDNKALRQAFYNTAATLFVVFAGFAAVSVFYILEAFLRPLLWAVLCGTFLHPFKSTLTSILRGWLQNLRLTRTPLAVGTVLIPLKIIDNATESLSGFFMRNIRLILGGTVALPIVYMMYYFGPLQQIFSGLMTFFVFLYDALGYFNAVWVWSMVLAYGLVVLLFWSPQSSVILRPLSVPVWVAIISHVATVAGPFRVPLLLLVVVMVIAGFVSEVNEARKKADRGQEVSSPSARAIWNIWSSSNRFETESSADIEVSMSDSDLSAETIGGSTAGQDTEEKVTMEKETSQQEKRPKDLKVETGSSTTTIPSSSNETQSEEELPETVAQKRTTLDMCFIGLLWALVLVRVWIHIWVLNLLPILFLCLIIKKFGTSLGSWKWLREHISSMAQQAKTAVTSDARADILAPRPIRGIGKLMLRGDRKIVKILESSLDQAVTILIVLLLLISTVVGTLFMVIQVHKESMHIVSLTSNVLNKTMQPEYMQWLPDQDEMKSTIDSMVANAYLYGREWIADKNTSHQPEMPHFTRQMSLDISNISSIWDLLSFSQNFNFDLVDLAKENIGTFMQVVDSLWSVLKGNISLVMNVLTATLSLLFGGGTALLNFFLSMIVFLTTLFYLLVSSGDTYKPMEWIASMNPTQGGQGTKFGTAVEEAISSVFLASLKMAAFYGLYTWLTHTVFGIQIVFIPSAMAAIFGAIPFLGTYFAAVPAIIELWLVNGQHIQAILLFVCHLLPMFYVDTAIYSEVKGGHPYLTGLAIAGGMYWLGLEGAIIGPILLCCLIVAMSVYSTMLQPDAAPSRISELSNQKDSATLTE